jgi:hypothetical protein
MPAPGHQRRGRPTPANRTRAIVAVHSYSMRFDPSPVHRSTVRAFSTTRFFEIKDMKIYRNERSMNLVSRKLLLGTWD